MSCARHLILWITLAAMFAAGNAYAACATPPGTAGDLIYNNTYNVMQFCNGTTWINMGTAGTGGFGTLTSGNLCTTDGTLINCTTASISLTAQVSGTLPVANGGTGVTALTSFTTALTTTNNMTAAAHIATGSTVPTNGMYLPAANKLGFATNSAGALYIDSSGNVGIGTATPGSALDIKGTLRLSGSTSGYVGLAPTAAAGSTTYTLPSADGTSGYQLTTNGSGVLSWAAAGGVSGGSAGYGAVWSSSSALTYDSALYVDATNHRVGIGTASPAQSLDVYGTIRSNTSGYAVRVYNSTGTTSLGYWWTDGTTMQFGAQASLPLEFLVGNIERMRIDASGGLLVGTTGRIVGYALTNIYGTTNTTPLALQSATAGYQAIDVTVPAATYLLYNRAVGGGVYNDGSNTQFLVGSAYRLKEDIQPVKGALASVMRLKPVTFTWKKTQAKSEGFIAHEVQEVIPEAVVGQKDAVNPDGTMKIQTLDKSYLIARLTGAIQELKAANDNEARSLEELRREFRAYRVAHP